MGKVDTDTDTPEHQFEDINLDDFPDNKSKSSSSSPPSTGSSIGRKKYSFHKNVNKIEPLENNGKFKAKEFDATPVEEFEREDSNSSAGELLLPEAKPVPLYKLVSLFFDVQCTLIKNILKNSDIYSTRKNSKDFE